MCALLSYLRYDAQADLLLAEELSFLSLLPTALSRQFGEKRGQSSPPPLVIMYLSSLKVRL